MKFLKILAVVSVMVVMNGCFFKYLDFGGVDEKPFEFRWGWERFEKGTGKPGTVDENGVFNPETPQADALLNFPDVHAGLLLEIRPESRLTPTVAIEVFEVKVPFLRWWSFQVGGGQQLVYFYAGKRLLSVVEVTIGPWYGWDFEERDWAWGVGGTLIKF